MKVLLADDDNTMRLYFTRYLQKRNFEVKACSSGEEAWDALQKDYYPLAMLDWNMPGMTGAEVCERMKQKPASDFQYVILITSRTDESDVVDGLNRGADDYITKPVIAAELEARLNAAERVINYEQQLRIKEKEVRLACYKTLTEQKVLFDLGIHNMSQDGVRALGRLYFRTSYGQNVLNHSKEVAVIAGMLAAEIGANRDLAKRAAVLHDIGKGA